jgi:hypothetical protein
MIVWATAEFADLEDYASRQGWRTPGRRDVVVPRGLWRQYWKDMDAYVTIKRVLGSEYREAKPQPPCVRKRAKEIRNAKETASVLS